MGRRRRKQQDRFAWFLRQEAACYKDSQQSGRPRQGVTWFSADALGHVALFASRETGNVPLAVFTNSLEEHLTLYEHFVRPSEEEMTGDVEVDAPQQGLYFYDLVDFYRRPILLAATVNTDGYDRLGVPDSPLLLSECPTRIQELLLRVKFDGLFSDTPKLKVRKHWKYV